MLILLWRTPLTRLNGPYRFVILPIARGLRKLDKAQRSNRDLIVRGALVSLVMISAGILLAGPLVNSVVAPEVQIFLIIFLVYRPFKAMRLLHLLHRVDQDLEKSPHADAIKQRAAQGIAAWLGGILAPNFLAYLFGGLTLLLPYCFLHALLNAKDTDHLFISGKAFDRIPVIFQIIVGFVTPILVILMLIPVRFAGVKKVKNAEKTATPPLTPGGIAGQRMADMMGIAINGQGIVTGSKKPVTLAVRGEKLTVATKGMRFIGPKAAPARLQGSHLALLRIILLTAVLPLCLVSGLLIPSLLDLVRSLL